MIKNKKTGESNPVKAPPEAAAPQPSIVLSDGMKLSHGQIQEITEEQSKGFRYLKQDMRSGNYVTRMGDIQEDPGKANLFSLNEAKTYNNASNHIAIKVLDKPRVIHVYRSKNDIIADEHRYMDAYVTLMPRTSQWRAGSPYLSRMDLRSCGVYGNALILPLYKWKGFIGECELLLFVISWRPEKDWKKSDVSQILLANEIGLFQTAPMNPYVRAHISSKLKVMVPDEIDTYDKLKDWIETNIKPVFPTPPSPAGGTTATPDATAPRFELEYEEEMTESGTCNYSVSRVVRTVGSIRVGKVRDIIEELEHPTLREVLEAVEEEMSDIGREHQEDLRTGDYNHDSHEIEETDRDGESPAMNLSGRKEVLAQYIRDNLPDMVERIDME